MREGKTLKTYSDRYWEMFNEIDGNFDDVAIRTFMVGLPAEHDLRKSLTRKPIRSVCQLMDRIDEYKRVEEDQQQGKGKVKVIPQDRRDFRSDRYNNNQPRRDFARQSGSTATQVVSTVFREPVHQLVKDERLKQFLYQPSGQSSQAGSRSQRDTSSRPPLDTINVTLAAPGRTGSHPSRVMFITRPPAEDSNPDPKRTKMEPYDDALVVTFRIEGYDVKKVSVNQGSGAKIMYPDLYNRLNLKPEDLTVYDSPLLGFNEKVAVPKGQIRLLVQVGLEVVEVDFIVVDAYSPYTAIVARPWLYALGGCFLHLTFESEISVQGPDLGAGWEPSAYKAPRVDSNFIFHHLNVNSAVVPKKQPPWWLSKEHSDAVKDEMIKLKQAGAIKEVFYPEWLANTVVVKKKSGKWRVCVEFTYLNKACPKNHFLMP
ncbi:uncharacterized protein LOC126727719 [Quercus robur]|uniref:uncharacterized protein LOC126727719 n=1 Tax=Quercus robur TaxID=38942 RepID=UPI0021624540|nr:uncharacterized protein LOC126727719 [Quercus robur]